jgi:hypothetical protein
MDRKKYAYHEAGHCLESFCAGAKINKVNMDICEHEWPADHKQGGDDNASKMGRVFDNILICVAGPICEVLYDGRFSGKDMSKSKDVQNLKEAVKVVLDKDTGKPFFDRKMMADILHDRHKRLADPQIFGKVDRIADAILAGQDVAKNIVELATNTRERTPQHNADALIEFLLKELYRN